MSATVIEHVNSREVYDSRGNPTIEVEVRCQGSRVGRAIVPSGASTGRFEAAELRDTDSGRLDGRGVRRAADNVRTEIASALIGKDASDQQDVDNTLCALDGTENKSRLGANAILGASLATAYAAAEACGVLLVEHLRTIWNQVRPSTAQLGGAAGPARLDGNPTIPLPMINMISGGLHAGGNLDFQDFLIVPVGAASLRQALEWSVTIYHRLGRILGERGYEGRLVGDEGGYGPRLENNRRAVELIVDAIEAAGLRPGEDVSIALDIASTHFFKNGRYHLSIGKEGLLTAEELIGVFESWVDDYPIVSIEDPLAEDDWDGWSSLTRKLGNRIQLIGDDLFVTNRARLRQGIERRAANSVLVKLNQIGTLWETLETLSLAMSAGYLPVVSARSGETEDTTIADLAVATGAGQIKIGSVARGERLCKYNQLLRLEERLGTSTPFAGRGLFTGLQRAAQS